MSGKPPRDSLKTCPGGGHSQPYDLGEVHATLLNAIDVLRLAPSFYVSSV